LIIGSTAAIAGIRLLVLLLLLIGALASMPVSHVMADYTASCRTEQPVMSGIVPRNTSDNGTLMQPLAGAGVELDASPITATAKAAGSKTAFMTDLL
jgi:hypothetical protein